MKVKLSFFLIIFLISIPKYYTNSILYLIKKAEIKNLTILTGTTIFKNVAGENLKYPAMKHTIAKGNGVVAARIKITHP